MIAFSAAHLIAQDVVPPDKGSLSDSGKYQPQDIHVACLLAGLAGAKGVPAVPITVTATWETNGSPRNEAAEDLVAIAKDHPQGKSGGRLEPGP